MRGVNKARQLENFVVGKRPCDVDEPCRDFVLNLQFFIAKIIMPTCLNNCAKRKGKRAEVAQYVDMLILNNTKRVRLCFGCCSRQLPNCQKHLGFANKKRLTNLGADREGVVEPSRRPKKFPGSQPGYDLRQLGRVCALPNFTPKLFPIMLSFHSAKSRKQFKTRAKVSARGRWVEGNWRVCACTCMCSESTCFLRCICTRAAMHRARSVDRGERTNAQPTVKDPTHPPTHPHTDLLQKRAKTPNAPPALARSLSSAFRAYFRRRFYLQ